MASGQLLRQTMGAKKMVHWIVIGWAELRQPQSRYFKHHWQRPAARAVTTTYLLSWLMLTVALITGTHTHLLPSIHLASAVVELHSMQIDNFVD